MTYMSHYDQPLEPAGVSLHVSRSRNRPRVDIRDKRPEQGPYLRPRFIFWPRRFTIVIFALIVLFIFLLVLLIAIGFRFIRHHNRVEICDLPECQ